MRLPFVAQGKPFEAQGKKPCPGVNPSHQEQLPCLNWSLRRLFLRYT